MQMTRLALTTSASGGGCLLRAGIADIVIPIGFRFVWGPLRSADSLVTLLATRSMKQAPTAPHWLDNFGSKRVRVDWKDLSLIEFCQRCETVELWIDPDPNAQLILVQLLDHFRSHAKNPPGLTLRQSSVDIGNQSAETLSDWSPAPVKILNDHLETASKVWQAYRQPTPQHWYKLWTEGLGILPRLPRAALDLLEELPGRATGLGATEMRMLELISEGSVGPFDVFPGRNANQRRVLDYWEVGSLLDGLTQCPAPAVSGLDGGPFTTEMHDDRERRQQYERSRLKLTALGQAILARSEDFSRHNPIRRWWGGTELTNDRLWRWDAVSQSLIAP
jgi:hypothetical protein